MLYTSHSLLYDTKPFDFDLLVSGYVASFQMKIDHEKSLTSGNSRLIFFESVFSFDESLFFQFSQIVYFSALMIIGVCFFFIPKHMLQRFSYRTHLDIYLFLFDSSGKCSTECLSFIITTIFVYNVLQASEFVAHFFE